MAAYLELDLQYWRDCSHLKHLLRSLPFQIDLVRREVDLLQLVIQVTTSFIAYADIYAIESDILRRYFFYGASRLRVLIDEETLTGHSKEQSENGLLCIKN